MSRVRRLAVGWALAFGWAAACPGWAPASTKAAYLHYLRALLLERQGSYADALQEYKQVVALDPSSSFIYAQAAELALQIGNTTQALELAQSFQELEPDNPKAYVLLGNIHWSLGDLQSARASFEGALKLKPGHPEALFALAKLLVPKDPKLARRHLEEYLKADPDNAPEVRYQIALLDHGQGKMEDARENLLKVIEEDPEFLQARFALAQIYELRRDTEAALSQYLEIASRDAQNANLLVHIGELHFIMGEPVRALDYLMQAKGIEPDHPGASLWLARLSELEQDFAAAASHLRASSQLSEDPALMLRLSYYLSQAGRLREAVAVLGDAHLKWPRNYEIAYFLALGHEDLKSPDKAIATLKKAVELKSGFREARFQLGALMERNGRMEEAEEVFRALLQEWPEDAPALNYLGYSLADRGLKLPEAEAFIRKAVKLDPDNGAYVDSLGWVHFKQGRMEEARKELEDAAAKLTTDDAVWEHLGETYLHFSQTEKAWHAFALSKALGPSNKGASARFAKLQGELPPETLNGLYLSFWKKASEDFDQLSSLALVEGRVAGRDFSLRGILTLRKGSALRLDILGPLWMPLFKLVLPEEGPFELDAQVEGVDPEVLSEAVRGGFEFFRNYLTGRLMEDREPAAHAGRSRKVVETADHEFFLAEDGLFPKSVREKGTGRRKLTVGDFRYTGTGFYPHALSLSGRGFSLTLKLQQVRFQ